EHLYPSSLFFHLLYLFFLFSNVSFYHAQKCNSNSSPSSPSLPLPALRLSSPFLPTNAETLMLAELVSLLKTNSTMMLPSLWLLARMISMSTKFLYPRTQTSPSLVSSSKLHSSRVLRLAFSSTMMVARHHARISSTTAAHFLTLETS
ncbi:hypothetical protein IQ06DRAFT_99934, partial [Phaeosphaeriaceae sp. SRC1lsM3a]